MLKYFRGLGATKKIYTRYVTTLRKWRITKGISVFAAFTFIATYGRRLLGKCLIVNPSPRLPALPDSHERLLLLVLWTKVSPLGPVNRPCTAGIAVEPFWPRSALLHLHICRFYNVSLFVVKNISCDKFSWFKPTTKYFNNENFQNYGIYTTNILWVC